MAQIVAPLNITAAALITQFGLVIIATVGTKIIRTYEPPPSVYDRPRYSSNLYTVSLVCFVITFGLLVFSDEFANTWKPLFSEITFTGFHWPFALIATFMVDIVWVTILVSMTGGSIMSPFSPVYFILPALAIFLREPLSRIVMVAFLVAIGFSLNLLFPGLPGDVEKDNRSRAKRIIAYWVVSIACLLLSTFIGYITRPR